MYDLRRFKTITVFYRKRILSGLCDICYYLLFEQKSLTLYYLIAPSTLTDISWK